MSLYDIYLEQAKQYHKNDKIWQGTTLTKYIPLINQIIKDKDIKTILDFGCGKAKHHPLEWNATKYDPAIPDYQNKPTGKFDLVISTDVLEHIPVANLKPIIDELFEYSNKWLFVSVCCRKAKAILPNGYNAHATIESAKWWRELFKPYQNYTLEFSE
jgi:2-polyprenyl-3-methyl-5-hydroxy-6-metoxy-1,4-benzoquinol methylase